MGILAATDLDIYSNQNILKGYIQGICFNWDMILPTKHNVDW